MNEALDLANMCGEFVRSTAYVNGDVDCCFGIGIEGLPSRNARKKLMISEGMALLFPC